MLALGLGLGIPVTKGKATGAPVLSGPGGVGSPIGLLLLLTQAV